MKILLLPFVLWIVSLLKAQNTAVASGAWSSCSSWGNPAIIYRNTSDTKTINNGVTVTADAAWSTAALALNGSGAVALNSGIFLDFVKDQGADVSCDALYAALQSAGCASCAAYSSAAINDYIMITEAEYNAIRTSLSNVTIVGSTDAQLNSANSPVGPAITQAIAPSQTKAPANSYITAFAAYMTTAVSSGTTRILKLKYNNSASNISGYSDYGGGSYAAFNQTATQKYFFVIKRPIQTTFSGGDSYIAIYNNVGLMTENNFENVAMKWLSDSNSLTITSTYRVCFQAIATISKQW